MASNYERHVKRCAKKHADKAGDPFIIHDYNTGSDDEGNADRTLTAVETVQKSIDLLTPETVEGDVPLPALKSKLKPKESSHVPLAKSLIPTDQLLLSQFLERIQTLINKFGITEPKRL